MQSEQILMLLVLLAFYAVYFGKMLMQRRQDVQTNQMGKGDKPKRTLIIERLLSISTLVIVPVEVMSIALNTRLFPTVGIAIAALGVVAFTAAMLTMSDSWRAGIPDRDKTALVTSGIYRVKRHWELRRSEIEAPPAVAEGARYAAHCIHYITVSRFYDLGLCTKNSVSRVLMIPASGINRCNRNLMGVSL